MTETLYLFLRSFLILDLKLVKLAPRLVGWEESSGALYYLGE